MGMNADITGRTQRCPPRKAGRFLRPAPAARPIPRRRVKILWKGLWFHMADSREVMNIRQASQYLGISPDTLYKYVYEEKIPAFKLGNRWKFKKTILDSWMERKSTMNEGRGKKKPKTARAVAH